MAGTSIHDRRLDSQTRMQNSPRVSTTKIVVNCCLPQGGPPLANSLQKCKEQRRSSSRPDLTIVFTAWGFADEVLNPMHLHLCRIYIYVEIYVCTYLSVFLSLSLDMNACIYVHMRVYVCR